MGAKRWADGWEDLEVFIKKEGGRAKRAGGETRENLFIAKRMEKRKDIW